MFINPPIPIYPPKYIGSFMYINSLLSIHPHALVHPYTLVHPYISCMFYFILKVDTSDLSRNITTFLRDEHKGHAIHWWLRYLKPINTNYVGNWLSKKLLQWLELV